MMRFSDSARWLVVPAAALLLGLAACGGDDDESDILPTVASFTITPVLTDPVVFLQKNPADTNNADNLVLVDVMLRHNAGVTFSGFSLEMNFVPGVVQVGQIDWSATPLGDCTGSNACDPICSNNVSPANPTTPKANETGNLLIGVAPKPLCPTANVTGTERLLSLSFIGASVGSSTLTLVDDGGTATQGDCEILDGTANRLPIACDSDAATITVTR